LLADDGVRLIVPQLLGNRLSDFLEGEILESESVLQRLASIRGLVRVNGVVAEERANSFSFPFPNQSLEAFGVDPNGNPVDEGTRPIQVPVHHSVLHGRLEAVFYGSDFPGSKILSDPIRAFEVALPLVVTRQVLHENRVPPPTLLASELPLRSTWD
jgi:hypothetical protein